MHYKVIACDVFTREVCWCAARTPNTLDIAFTPKGEHNEPTQLRRLLQAAIDAAAASGIAYDAVLLAYGLCGNATVGLTANSFPLVIPRAHDCTTVFLGGKEAFEQHFGACPSQGWTSVGYSERGDSVISDSEMRLFLQGGMSAAELIEQYGEENARYLMESLSVKKDFPEVPFIDVPETHMPELAQRIRDHIARLGKTCRVLSGAITLIEGLVAGGWPEDRYLVVPPGQRIAGVYDYAEVMRAEGG